MEKLPLKKFLITIMISRFHAKRRKRVPRLKKSREIAG
jgi:hypothetical protein